MTSQGTSKDVQSSSTKEPPALNNGVEEVDRSVSNVLVAGLRRSGKTSILQVIFNRCAPKDTLFLEPTPTVSKTRFDSAVPVEFWDCPGNLSLSTIPLDAFSALLFVIDIQDKFTYSIPQLTENVLALYQVNPDINVEVFVHKSDALTDDYRIETFRHVQQRIVDELQDLSIDVEMLQLQFHLTSIHDHSIYESLSQLVQKVIDPLPYLEDLLNVFSANSRLSKAFLFDTYTRIYVATDASPVDRATHNLCVDYVHLLSQFVPLYSDGTHKSSRDPSQWTSSSVRLNPDTMLAYWQITRNLAIVVLMPSEMYDTRRGLVEYNLVFFKEGVQEILDVDAAERRHLEPAKAT